MMKRNLLLRVAVVSVFAGASTMSNAVVNLATSADDSATYATELTVGGTTNLTGTGVDVTGTFGFGVSGAATRYIRFDLTNAKFGAAVVPAWLTATSGAAFTSVSIVQGGTTSDSYVIFQVTAGAAGNAATDTISFTLGTGGVKPTATSTPVSIAYAIHETAANAVANTTPLASKSENLAKFGPAMKVTWTPATNTASVVKDFKEWTGAVSATLANLGTVGIQFDQAFDPATGAIAAAVTKFVDTAAAQKVTLNGEFAAKGTTGKLYLSTTANCAASAADLAFATGNTSTGSADVKALLTVAATTWNLCYSTPDKTAAITAQTVTGLFDLNAATGSTAADTSATTAGTIVRDGTTLQTPWFSNATGYISRFIITNTGPAAVNYNSSCLVETGNTATAGAAATGSVPANGQLVIDATGVCTFSGNSRGAAIFNVIAPPAQIKGAYNVVNPTSGSVSVSAMQ